MFEFEFPTGTGAKADYDCIKAFSETVFTEDLKKIDVPTLDGDDDQIVPFADAGPLSAKLLKKVTTSSIPKTGSDEAA
jgi:non-heme chloroperoxidase